MRMHSTLYYKGEYMLDLTTTFYAPGEVTSPLLRSFMTTFQVSIRNRDAVSPASRNMYVKAFDSEQATGIASLLIAPYDMTVTGVMSAGSEDYGLEDISDADPLPMLKTVKTVTDDIFGF